MSSARVARLIAALRSFSRKTIGSGEAGRATGGDFGFGAGAGAGTGAATTAGLFTERRTGGDFGSGAGVGAGTCVEIKFRRPTPTTQ